SGAPGAGRLPAHGRPPRWVRRRIRADEAAFALPTRHTGAAARRRYLLRARRWARAPEARTGKSLSPPPRLRGTSTFIRAQPTNRVLLYSQHGRPEDGAHRPRPGCGGQGGAAAVHHGPAVGQAAATTHATVRHTDPERYPHHCPEVHRQSYDRLLRRFH